MNIRCEFICDFKNLKSAYHDVDKLDLLIKGDIVSFMGLSDGVYTIQHFDATVNRSSDVDKERLISVSIYPTLLFQLPSAKNGRDIITTEIFDDRVSLKVNAFTVMIVSGVYDRSRTHILSGIKEFGPEIPIDDLRWMVSTCRMYKNIILHFTNQHISASTVDGVFCKRLTTPITAQYALPVSYFVKTIRSDARKIYINETVTAICKGGRLLISEVYKADSRLADDIKFASKQKFKCKVHLNLYRFSDLFKVLKQGNVVLNLINKELIISASQMEQITIQLGDLCDIDTSKVGDFDELMAMGDVVGKIKISSPNILKLIALEERGVNIMVGPLANIINFGNHSYCLLSEEK